MDIDYLTRHFDSINTSVDLELDIVKHLNNLSFEPEFDEAITMALEQL